MGTIDEPIEVGSAPSDFDYQRCVQRGCQPLKGTQRQSVQPASLGARNRVPRNTSLAA
jgi:hypothetical protein